MIRFAKFATALIALSVIAFSSGVASAAGGGQIEGGDIYWVKDVTTGSGFVDPNTANPGDTLLYRVRIHNPGPDCLTNVNLKAIVPAGANQISTSTITIWADNATTNYISDTATVNLSSAQTITYVPGSTQVLNNSGVISNPADGILGSGINIGTVCVSTGNERFIQFQAKVGTPAPATVTTTSTPAKPVVTALPNTGPGDVLEIFTGASAVGGAGHYLVNRRRRN